MLLFVEKVFHIPSTDKDIWGYDDHVLIHPVGNMYNIIIPYKYAYYVIVIRQSGCLTENLLTKQTYIM